MSAQLEIGLESRPLERVSADLVGAAYFADDRPLRGGSGRLDWRLCGLISERLASGEFTGAAGEVALIAAGGALRAPRVLLLGLGERAGFQVADAATAMRELAVRCLDLGLHNLLVAPPGIASDDFPRHAGALLEGALDAVRESEERLDLWLLVAPGEVDRAQQALEDAVRGSDSPELIANAPLPRSSRDPARRAAPTPGGVSTSV